MRASSAHRGERNAPRVSTATKTSAASARWIRTGRRTVPREPVKDSTAPRPSHPTHRRGPVRPRAVACTAAFLGAPSLAARSTSPSQTANRTSTRPSVAPAAHSPVAPGVPASCPRRPGAAQSELGRSARSSAEHRSWFRAVPTDPVGVSATARQLLVPVGAGVMAPPSVPKSSRRMPMAPDQATLRRRTPLVVRGVSAHVHGARSKSRGTAFLAHSAHLAFVECQTLTLTMRKY